MPELIEKLEKIGLTKNESKVYFALLKLGMATAAQITKESGVHRVNVYDVLERLREKGMLSSIMESNKRVFEASDPDVLFKFLKQKEELLSEILPTLKAEHKSRSTKEKVYSFYGPDGVLQSYYMMLDQDELIYALGGSGSNRQYLKHRHKMFRKELLRRGARAYALYYEFTRKDPKHGNDYSNTKMRYLPDEFKTECMVDICGDLVVNLIPVEGNVKAIVIESRALADTYRQFFNFMWKHSNE